LSPTDSDGAPLPASALVPRAPSPHTALSWTDREASGRLIDYGAVLYRIERYNFGAETAGLPSPSPLPADAMFQPLFAGEPVMRPAAEPHTIDTPGMPWPPLEGYYAYEIRGMNLLGFVSSQGARALVRHHDDLPPHSPRARAVNGPGATVDADGAVTAELKIDWDSSEDFASPDVVEFRVAASFSALTSVAVQVTELLSANPLACTIRVASLDGPADRHAGLRLMLPNGEFVIVNHGAGAPTTMTVRRSGGRAPAVGATGAILFAGPPTTLTRIARMDRTAAVAVTVEALTSLEPVELRLAPYVPINAARVYVHLLRATFDAVRTGATASACRRHRRTVRERRRGPAGTRSVTRPPQSQARR
jgi:hypothetical protein